MEGDTLPTAAPTLDEAHDITEGDLIAALLAAAMAEDATGAVPGMTTGELCDATGRSDKWVRRRLLALKRVGLLAIDYGQRESLSGTAVMVPVYRMAGCADEANENHAD